MLKNIPGFPRSSGSNDPSNSLPRRWHNAIGEASYVDQTPGVLGSMGCKQAQSRALVLLAAVVSRQFLLQDVDPEIQASEHQDRNNHQDKPINQSLIGANLQVPVTLHLIRKNVKHDPSLRIRRDCAGRHPVMSNAG